MTTRVRDMKLKNQIMRLQKCFTLPSFLDPLRPGVVAPDRILSMGQRELFDHLSAFKQMTEV